MGSYLTTFLLLTGVGCVFAFPVLIPQVRRWLRVDMGRRVAAVITLSLTVLILTFVTFAYLGAQLQTYFLCHPFTDFVSQMCEAEEATQFGFTSSEEMEAAVAQELFRRAVTPPPFRQDCYSDDPAFCEFVRPSSSDDGDLISLLAFLWPAIVTGLLAWWGTRPPSKHRADGL
ncbi:MAG: hypothetical protein GY796_02935 [Chloroflexi bacterium]|nr:hypothetical protein [Chloroflexota bacterium]